MTGLSRKLEYELALKDEWDLDKQKIGEEFPTGERKPIRRSIAQSWAQNQALSSKVFY